MRIMRGRGGMSDTRGFCVLFFCRVFDGCMNCYRSSLDS